MKKLVDRQMTETDIQQIVDFANIFLPDTSMASFQGLTPDNALVSPWKHRALCKYIGFPILYQFRLNSQLAAPFLCFPQWVFAIHTAFRITPHKFKEERLQNQGSKSSAHTSKQDFIFYLLLQGIPPYSRLANILLTCKLKPIPSKAILKVNSNQQKLLRQKRILLIVHVYSK